MPTVGADLDKAVTKLHDTSARIWPRAELLRWYQDGYRQLLARSGGVRRLVPLDVPGRHTYAITQEWEDRHASRGSVRKMHRAAKAGTRQATSLWEVEHLAGVTPTISSAGFTQEWERAHADVSDRHFRFTLPHNHERLVRLEWHNRRLSPVSTRELDNSDTDWWQTPGEPRWWTTGTGRVKSVDLYETTPTNVQGYALYDYERGLPRGVSGDRTWATAHDSPPAYTWVATTSADTLHAAAVGLTVVFRITLATATSGLFAMQAWEVELVADFTDTSQETGAVLGLFQWERFDGATVPPVCIGTIRGITSTTRQYVPVYSDTMPHALMGRVADWRSSADSVLAIEVVVPDHPMAETDRPSLIPEPIQKYLRFYVLGMAFGRAGEGRNSILSEHYMRRFDRGVALMRRFGDLAHRDRQWVREVYEPKDRRLPYVRLPATYPRVI